MDKGTLSCLSLDEEAQAHREGYYYPLGGSVCIVLSGDWTEPTRKPGCKLDYICDAASNLGLEFAWGKYLCQVTVVPWTMEVLPNSFTESIMAPYYMIYYERLLSVRNNISDFLHKMTFGPQVQDIHAFEAVHTTLRNGWLISVQAMEQLQMEWVQKQMDLSMFSTGLFLSLQRYRHNCVNVRAFEVYRMGE